MMPSNVQSRDGSVSLDLGAKGVIEVQLVASGDKWGRGPAKDIHSSLMARVDSPAWHLVKALDTLVADDGFTPTVDGWFENVRALTPHEKELLAACLPKDEEAVKKVLGVRRWIKDEDFLTSAYRLASQPTVNIQGLVSGYTGPGGKTVLPGFIGMAPSEVPQRITSPGCSVMSCEISETSCTGLKIMSEKG
jgi:hypothetical protein